MRKQLELMAKEILEDNVLMYGADIDIDRVIANKSDAELREIILGRWY